MDKLDKTKWDQAAVDYQRVFRLGLSEYNRELLRFWEESGMLFPGARVLDIGCGVGKYGSYLAELGYDVTLTDISENMLRHARENMAKYRTPWAVYCCDFNEVTGEEPVFAKGFDLALSTMSPAIHDAATVRKMSSITRAWCFLARFCSWEQPFRDSLLRQMGLPPRRLFNDLAADAASMLEAVRESGFTPSVTEVDYNWSDSRTPEEMADYLYRYYFTEDENWEDLRQQALELCRAWAGPDGTVEDAINTRVSWIFWKTQKEP